MENNDLKVGVNPIIINEIGEILLGRRLKKAGYGTYGLPGGHLKNNETIEEATIREIREETSLIVKLEDVEVINVARTNENIQFGVLVKKYEGIPKICEPDKCDDQRFFNVKEFPSLFKGTSVNIELYLKNKFYDKDINII
ncbi:MAG: NUDIX domain-containing protein [Clostridia bacterium]|nr:NUDIX domain-containing protein [Clostridia bacterium]MDD4386731.1 NUDIX domain-containing protein [Clostridia bacterium]